MIVELCPNPDGCKRFEPNTFKKEKCKNCGRPWTEHKGVIDDATLQRYTAALQKAANDKNASEEAARQKTRAKQIAKKKAVQDVTDEWLFDGDAAQKAVEAEESDDDMGFSMFTPDASAQAAKAAEPNKTFKVTNLLDFGQDDDDEEEEPAQPATSAAASPVAVHQPQPMGTPPPRQERQITPQVDLELELQTLRQMLADANEMKKLEVEMVKDEVAEKQQLIEELTRSNAESQATVEGLRRETEALKAGQGGATESGQGGATESGQAEHWQAEHARLQAQVEELSRRAEEQAAELEASHAARAAAEAAAAAAQGEAEAAKGEASRAREAEQEARRAAETAQQRATAAPLSPLSPTAAPLSPQATDSSRAEAHAVAQQMGRHAAQALREIRLNAEMQLAWLSKRRLMDSAQLAAAKSPQPQAAVEPVPSS